MRSSAMSRVIYVDGQYKILKTGNRSYTVINTEGPDNRHAHFCKRSTAQKLIDLIQQHTIPHSHYLRIAAIRVSSDKHYTERVEAHINKTATDYRNSTMQSQRRSRAYG
jgi:hypothetical protein